MPAAPICKMRPRTDQHKLLQQLFATLDILGFYLNVICNIIQFGLENIL